MDPPEECLPPRTRARAFLRGNEYAWRPEDIPSVIAAGRAANMANIGGQLQLHLPDGGTCECYWIKVDTYNSVCVELPWPERVAATASTSLAQFQQLIAKYDLLSETRAAFPRYVEDLEATGVDPSEHLWFVWYLEAQPQSGGTT
jgi:hypothetical protein